MKMGDPKGKLSVEYGNDLEGTCFAPRDSQDPLGGSAWNLQVSYNS